MRFDISYYIMFMQEEPDSDAARSASLADISRSPTDKLRRTSRSADFGTRKQLQPTSLQPHTAYQSCLHTWLPFLAAEADHAAVFLLLYDAPLVKDSAAAADDEQQQFTPSRHPQRQKSGAPLSPSRKRSLASRISSASARSDRSGRSDLSQLSRHWGLPVMAAPLQPEARKALGSLLAGLKTDFLSLVGD